MSEHADPIFLDAKIEIPIDDPYEQIEISVSNTQNPTKCTIDPLATAALLLKSRAVWTERLHTNHVKIDDISWHILLDLAVSIDAKKPVARHELAVRNNVALSTISRYVAYLIGLGLVEENVGNPDEGQPRLTLTSSGHELTNNILTEISRQLVSV